MVLPVHYSTQTLSNFIVFLISIVVIIGDGVLLASLVSLSLQILSKKLQLHSVIKVVIFSATLASLVTFIFGFTMLGSLLISAKFPVIYPPEISNLILFVLFPLIFICYLAWKQEIPLIIRYGIILAYIVFISLVSALGFVIFMEQVYYKSRLCLGFTCPASISTQKPDVIGNPSESIVSIKPREKVIQYKVVPGDSLASIANKFDISVDTIKWANYLTENDFQVGILLKIPPVTGIVHDVVERETIYTIANKYNTSTQNIINFPWNIFKNLKTYEMTPGQILYVPDGKMN